MAIQIAFSWSKECEQELIDKGFSKREVYVKHAPPLKTEESIQKGNAEFFSMRHRPHMFITTSYWAAEFD